MSFRGPLALWGRYAKLPLTTPLESALIHKGGELRHHIQELWFKRVEQFSPQFAPLIRFDRSSKRYEVYFSDRWSQISVYYPAHFVCNSRTLSKITCPTIPRLFALPLSIVS